MRSPELPGRVGSAMRDGNGLDSAALLQRIRALGPQIGPAVLEPTVALFSALHPAAPESGVDVSRDHAYGRHPRHRLDVFRGAAMPASQQPVLLFVHGGGFTGGDKAIPGRPFYANVGNWAVRNGMVGVNMTYRLAPEHPWPAGPEDVASAVAWVRANIAAMGGDPAQLFLMGHSAGAVHAAAYAAQPKFHGTDGHGLAGLILVAGLYAFAGVAPNPILASYFGSDGDLYGERSSVPQISSVEVPVMVAVGEFDPPEFQQQAAVMMQALLQRDGRVPRMARLTGHSHYSEIMAFGLDYAPELARQIIDFVGWDCRATKR
ncbi:MAG: alpha/beta hydrolase [Rhodospirillaceae bacterium]|nr:alpha/beta hydrolase [Rhodospirillaceae bacterium]